MKALILNTGSELKKTSYEKKVSCFNCFRCDYMYLRIGGNVLVSKITGGEVVIKSNLNNGNGRICF